MQTASRKVGEFLVNRKVLSKDDLEYALRKEADSGVPLAKILSAEGLVSERDLVAAVADQLRVPFWDPTTTPVSPLVDGMIPAELAGKQMVVGVAIDGDALLVATDNPLDEGTMDVVEPSHGLEGQALPGDPLGHRWSAGSHVRAQPDHVGGHPTPAPMKFPPRLHVNQILVKVVEARGSDLHLTAGRPAHGPHRRRPHRAGGLRGADPFEGPGPGLRDPVAETPGALREQPGAGHFPRRARALAGSGSTCSSSATPWVPSSAPSPSRSSRLEQLGLPRVRAPVRRPAPRPRARAPARPARANRPRWPRSSTSSTPPSRCTSCRSRTPSSTCTTTRRPWSTRREVGEDTKGFAEALKHVLRQDPDVILIGEMRDLETISTALTAAETGHLVFATLHTQDAPQSIDRMIDVFPAHQQQQIRTQLATTIQGVVTQQLLPRASGLGRVVACEVLVATPGGAQPHPGRQDATRSTAPCKPAPSTACRAWTRCWPSW